MAGSERIRNTTLYHGEHETPLGRVMWAGTTQVHGAHQHRSMQILGAYALVYMTRGKGTFRNAAEYYGEFGPGDLFLLFPSVGHQYGATTSEGLDEFYITFKGPVFELWERAGLLNPQRPQIRLDPTRLWLTKLRAVVESTPNSEADALRDIHALCVFLTEAIVADKSKQEVKDEVLWLSQARSLLGSNLHSPLTAPAVAEEVGISYDTFRHDFRKHTGLSPARYRLNQRIAAACDLLSHSSMRIYEIAELLGFNTEFHFSQRFKEAKGVSPSQYRAGNRRT